MTRYSHYTEVHVAKAFRVLVCSTRSLGVAGRDQMWPFWDAEPFLGLSYIDYVPREILLGRQTHIQEVVLSVVWFKQFQEKGSLYLVCRRMKR